MSSCRCGRTDARVSFSGLPAEVTSDENEWQRKRIGHRVWTMLSHPFLFEENHYHSSRSE